MGMMVLLLNPSEIDYVSFYEQYQFADPDPVAVESSSLSLMGQACHPILCVWMLSAAITHSKRERTGVNPGLVRHADSSFDEKTWAAQQSMKKTNHLQQKNYDKEK